MSLVTPAKVRALVDTDLSDADLSDVIAREEAALARVLGPLSGERTETLYISLHPAADELPIYLRRPTDAVTVTDAGVVITGLVRLHAGGRAIERTDLGVWTGPVATTYTPNDDLECERVVIELTRLTLTETGYLSETIGDYMYSRGARGGAANPTESARSRLIASLMPPAIPHSMRTPTSRRLYDTSAVYPRTNLPVP